MGGTFCSEAWAAISNYVDTIFQEALFKQIERKTIGSPVVLAVSGRSSLKLNY